MTLSDIPVRFKQIPDFGDYYITERGEVYSMRLRGNESISKLHKLKPKTPKQSNKYLNIILCNEHGQVTKSIHRLVAENFVDGYFEGAVVNHIDGDNRNNIYTNLEWVTVRENIHKSYITSGKSAKRNWKEWRLYDPQNTIIGTFSCHADMETFIKTHNIDAAPTQLTKNGKSRGYTAIKTEICN